MPSIVCTSTPVPQAQSLIPAVDYNTGMVVWIPEQAYRLHQSRGDRLSLSLVLDPMPDKSPEKSSSTSSTSTSTAYSEPRTVQQWAQAFGVCTKTMARWFKTAQVDAVAVGRFWKVALRDIPSAT